jgi:hypothetical protein
MGAELKVAADSPVFLGASDGPEDWGGGPNGEDWPNESESATKIP